MSFECLDALAVFPDTYLPAGRPYHSKQQNGNSGTGTEKGMHLRGMMW